MSNVLDKLTNGTTQGEATTVVSPAVTAPHTPAIADGKGTVDVIPYHANSDPNAHAFLSWFWKRLHDAGLIQLYYPEAPDYSYAGFVKLFSGSTGIALVVKKDEAGEIIDTVGFATLEMMQFGLTTAAHAGFIFLPEYWDRKTSEQAAHRIVDFWFSSETLKLDVVIGIIAQDNVLARRFLQRIGWTHSGNIPYVHQYGGKRSDASIWYITREAFDGRT